MTDDNVRAFPQEVKAPKTRVVATFTVTYTLNGEQRTAVFVDSYPMVAGDIFVIQETKYMLPVFMIQNRDVVIVHGTYEEVAEDDDGERKVH